MNAAAISPLMSDTKSKVRTWFRIAPFSKWQTTRWAALALVLVSAVGAQESGLEAQSALEDSPAEDLPQQKPGARADLDALAAAGALFETGDAVGARSEYLRQVEASPSATLYYNLGRVEQELGQYPQAVLWYRRALDLASEDPWAMENLVRLRTDLGVAPPDPWQPMAVLSQVAKHSGWVAGGFLSLLLLLRWIGGRPRGWALVATGVLLAAGHLGLQAAAGTIAPVTGVLMADCQADALNLPGGSEVWVSQTNPAKVWSSAGTFRCQPENVVRVRSSMLPPTSSFSESSSPSVQPESSEITVPTTDSAAAPPFV